MRPHPLTLALLAAFAIPAHAQTAAPAQPDGSTDDTRELDRVVLVATRTERAMVDVPATVDEIDRAQMDKYLVGDLKDLFRYEPGITVSQA